MKISVSFLLTHSTDQDYLDNMVTGFRHMSNYLYDVFDGQMYLGKVYIYDNKENWNEADIWVYANNVQHPGSRGNISDLVYWNSHVRMPRVWCRDSIATMNWSCWDDDWGGRLLKPSDYRTKAHEVGHYGLGFWDEYKFLVNGEYSTTEGRCSAVPNYGFMDYHYEDAFPPYNSEMSSDFRYDSELCRNTEQYETHGSSCWGSFDSLYQKVEGFGGLFCPIKTPSEGNVTPDHDYFLGPNNDTLEPFFDNPNYDVGGLLFLGVDNSETGANTIVALCHDSANTPIAKAEVWQWSPAGVVKQGRTADPQPGTGNQFTGKIRILGYHVGDWVQAGIGYWVDVKSVQRRTWLYGQGSIGGSGISEYGNRYSVSPNGDSLYISLAAVEGDYPLIYCIQFSAGVPNFVVFSEQSFSDDPMLELHPDDLPSANYGLQAVPSGYSALLTDSIGLSGVARILAPDDSGSIFFVNTAYCTAFSTDSTPVSHVFSPDGSCNLFVDSQNTTLDQVIVLSSPYPIIRSGLKTDAEQAGDIHALYGNQTNQLSGENSLSIHYQAGELSDDTLTAFLRVFEFSTLTLEWEEVGGSVDTSRNLVSVSVDHLGIYGLFTSAPPLCGDINGDGNPVIDIADLVYLVDYMFQGGPPPPAMDAADVDGSGGIIDIADLVYLVDYMFNGGPAPVCL